MLDTVQSMIAYICLKYPTHMKLSKARLTKLVYLADWYSSYTDRRQITKIQWLFNHFGPYVNDVVDSVKGVWGFEVCDESTGYGTNRSIISYHGSPDWIRLTQRECDFLDAVVDSTKNMCFNDFIDLVYSTYPVRTQERYTYMDLPQLASECKAMNQMP